MMYECRLLRHENSEIIVSILLSNTSLSFVKELDFNVCDTPSLKLLQEDNKSQYGIKLQLQLPPSSASEAQFAFQVTDVIQPQKLRGTLAYMVQTPDGLSTPEKLDFWLTVPCSSFMVGKLSHRHTLTDLLSSGQLIHRNSLKFNEVEHDFSQVLSLVCFHCHFILVEQIDRTASLYSRSLHGHHVCLLLKADDSSNRVTIDGKSNCELLLASLMMEIQSLIQSFPSSADIV